jgi:hypothetical protein
LILKKFCLISILSILFITGLYYLPVNAYSNSLGANYIEATTMGDAQYQMVTHSTGVVGIVSYYDGATSHYQKISIKLIDPITDTVKNNQVINLASTLTFMSNSGVYGLVISELDSDELLIGFNWAYSSSYCQTGFIRYNINSYVATIYQSATRTISGCWYASLCTPIFSYNSKFWIVMIDDWSGYATVHMEIYSFNPSTNAVTKEVESTGYTRDSSQVSRIMAFQNTANLAQIYFITSLDDAKTERLYLATLSGTPSIGSAIASGSGSFSIPDGATISDLFNNWFTFIEGGIYTTGTLYYLHFTWCYSLLSAYPTGIREVVTNQWRIEFNNTISSGTIIAQNQKTYLAVDESGSTSALVGMNWGFIESNGAPYPDVIRVFFQNIYSGKNVASVDMTIASWTTMSNGAFDTVQITRGVDNIDFSYLSYDNLIVKNPMYGYSYQISSDTVSYLCTNELVNVANYSLTVSYSPLDSPLHTGKWYNFIFTLYVNNVLDSGTSNTFRIYVDSLERAGGSYSTGIDHFDLYVSASGVHTIQLYVYDSGGSWLYTSAVYSYTFTTPPNSTSAPPQNTILTNYYVMFMSVVPILGFVFVPMIALAIIGAKYAGPMGMIICMLSGGLVGVISGVTINLLPTYLLYLYILLMGVSLIMVIMSGRSSGGGA